MRSDFLFESVEQGNKQNALQASLEDNKDTGQTQLSSFRNKAVMQLL